MYVVLDTETSGLFRHYDENGRVVRSDDPSQPYLAQLAMILVNANFEIEGTFDAYVCPDGWEMQPGATAVNHLTTEFLMANGRPAEEVLPHYTAAIKEGRSAVAFNAQHDLRTMRGALRRAGMDDLFEQTPNICVMRALLNICCVPRKRGNGFRWPKLREAMEYFDLPFEKAHEGPGDALAAYQLLCKLNEMGDLPEPRVYHAKNFLAEEEAV